MLILLYGYDNGRLGNCVQQYLACILENLYYYKENKVDFREWKNVSFERFLYCKNFFKDIPDFIDFDFPKSTKIIKENIWKMKNKENISLLKIMEITQKYFLEYIDLNIINNHNIDFDKDLVIHIRSGDILGNLKLYTQPPYYFYKKIIENNNYPTIFIISENKGNPVINKLLENFKNIKFISNTPDIDLKILLKSKNLVTSNSTFSNAAIHTYHQNIYVSKTRMFNIYKKQTNNKITQYNCDDFYNKIKNSNFNNTQIINEMLNSYLENIEIITT